MFCQSCGAQIPDGAKFCSACGASPQQAGVETFFMANTTYVAPSPEADAQQNKGIAIIAYFLFFIPLIAAKDSKFALYHANQGLILAICSVVLSIVFSILSTILLSTLSLGMLGIISLLWTAIWIGIVVLLIFGVVNASQGRMKPLPVIGSLFTIIR